MNAYYIKSVFIFLDITQLQKLMKKDILTEILFFNRKDQTHQRKNLVENVDVFYEIGIIQTFISEFKNKKSKKLEEKIKPLKINIIKDDR